MMQQSNCYYFYKITKPKNKKLMGSMRLPHKNPGSYHLLPEDFLASLENQWDRWDLNSRPLDFSHWCFEPCSCPSMYQSSAQARLSYGPDNKNNNKNMMPHTCFSCNLLSIYFAVAGALGGGFTLTLMRGIRMGAGKLRSLVKINAWILHLV